MKKAQKPVAGYDLAEPRPGALIESLRAVGYSLPAAVADIVDNSLTAKARNIWLNFHWAGAKSYITILDDGVGMTGKALFEAMRPGTTSPLDTRSPDDLGRFGLGLKTASFSQCRNLTVWSKRSVKTINGRRWDLSYVAKHNEWRLLKDLPPDDTSEYARLKTMPSGTLVVWSELDRIVLPGTAATNDDAHSSFIALINDVKSHLGMIFHRYLSGEAAGRQEPVRIYVNGTDETQLITPWDPFQGGKNSLVDPSPKDVIFFNNVGVTVRGYVMPHKDRLTEAEYAHIAGPRGWLAQQGYYVYRNDRILVAGDWLRLSESPPNKAPFKKEEHYKLARLSIDIPNSTDLDWGLDVKKSTAHPPAVLIGRLSELAERVRGKARSVFAHRGQYGSRSSGTGTPTVEAHPWKPQRRNGLQTYKINRDHPLIAEALLRLGPLASIVEPVLRLVEETVPVERIWLDKADDRSDHAVPYQDIEEAVIVTDIEETLAYLRRQVKDLSLCKKAVLTTPPFDRYPHLVDQVFNQLGL